MNRNIPGGPLGPESFPSRPGPQGGQPSEDYPAWDWNRNNPDHPEFEMNRNKPFNPLGPDSYAARPGPEGGQPPEDHPAWDWNRNRPDHPEFEMDRDKPFYPGAPESMLRMPAQPDEGHPEWGWNRNAPDHPDFEMSRSKPLAPVANPDVVNKSAPWASAPDEESDEGAGPRPMAIPEDLYSEPSDQEKEQPKGTVLPVWLSLTLIVLASFVGASSVATPPPVTGAPPNIAFNPIAPATGAPPALPNLPVTPLAPCPQDAGCNLIMAAIDPVMPPKTRALINIPGTCQNWAREWLRTGKDIMVFTPQRVRQRFAMALVYCEFNGDNWLEGDLWVSDLHECDWYTMIGVDPCSRFEEYQIIRNYGQQMRGTLPPELSMMSTLWEVSLSDNLISGTIPSDYAKLSELDTFAMSYNLLKGPIPDFMWKFEDMVYFDLAYNYFSGKIPDGVYLTEPRLRNLLLSNNDLTGTIPDDFSLLDWQRLHLDNNALNGKIPPDINAGRTEEIFLHNNQLTGTFPARDFATNYDGQTSHLKEVSIYGNNLEGDVSDMCDLFFNGQLTVFEVDLQKTPCPCCSQGGV